MPRAIPGPANGLLGLRHFGPMRRDLLGFFRQLHADYGGIALLRFGPIHYCSLAEPDLIREVLVTQAKSFPRLPRPMQVLAQWNGASMLTVEGDEWRRQRRLAQPAFHASRFRSYGEYIVAAAQAAAESWLAEPGPVDIESRFTALTLGIIGRTFFGVDLSPEQRRDLARAVAILSDVATREMQSLFTWPLWLPLPGQRAKRWAMATLDRFIRGVIAERRSSGADRGDLLSMLLAAVDEEPGGRNLSDEEVRNNAMTLFIAGHDTVASGLTWTWHLLAEHADVAQRMRAEVDSVLGRRSATIEELPRLRYTEGVVKEALRLFPPAIAAFTRQAAADVQVGDYLIRRGTYVQPWSFLPHRDPRWFPDPDRPDPERFLPERAKELPPFAYFPFGGGPRICIGNTFAMMEMTLITATLAQRLTVKTAPERGPVEPHAAMSLRPRGGLWLHLTRQA